MALNAVEQEKVNRWINSKRVRPQCGACGSNNWVTGDVVSAPVFHGGGIALGGPSVPMVQLICGNCGHVMLFAAVPMGLAN